MVCTRDTEGIHIHTCSQSHKLHTLFWNLRTSEKHACACACVCGCVCEQIYIYVYIYKYNPSRSRCNTHYICCSVLQCVAVCCIMLQCVGSRCNTLNVCKYTHISRTLTLTQIKNTNTQTLSFSISLALTLTLLLSLLLLLSFCIFLILCLSLSVCHHSAETSTGNFSVWFLPKKQSKRCEYTTKNSNPRYIDPESRVLNYLF